MDYGKLISLLNEYETPKSGIVFKSYDAYDGTFYGIDCDGETEIAWSDSYICGKRYKFIEWLVENNKIDTNYGPGYGLHRVVRIENGEKDFYPLYESLLMLLAISDTPIDDLCSYLKD